MYECSSRSFDSWVNSLKALSYLNFTKMCHQSSSEWKFSWGLFETNGKIYLNSPAFPCGGDSSLAPMTAWTNPKRFTLTVLSYPLTLPLWRMVFHLPSKPQRWLPSKCEGMRANPSPFKHTICVNVVFVNESIDKWVIHT